MVTATHPSLRYGNISGGEKSISVFLLKRHLGQRLKGWTGMLWEMETVKDVVLWRFCRCLCHTARVSRGV